VDWDDGMNEMYDFKDEGWTFAGIFTKIGNTKEY
jgi:hypothetical protein